MTAPYEKDISRVCDQNGISRLYINVKICHSGQKPSIWLHIFVICLLVFFFCMTLHMRVIVTQDTLLSLAKAVANATAALVLKAKTVASTTDNPAQQNRVISSATQCALATSQLVACTKVRVVFFFFFSYCFSFSSFSFLLLASSYYFFFLFFLLLVSSFCFFLVSSYFFFSLWFLLVFFLFVSPLFLLIFSSPFVSSSCFFFLFLVFFFFFHLLSSSSSSSSPPPPLPSFSFPSPSSFFVFSSP